MNVYDTYRRLVFEGLQSESPNAIRNHPEEIVFVTTYGAKNMAQAMFTEMGKKKGSYAFLEVIL